MCFVCLLQLPGVGHHSRHYSGSQNRPQNGGRHRGTVFDSNPEYDLNICVKLTTKFVVIGVNFVVIVAIFQIDHNTLSQT